MSVNPLSAPQTPLPRTPTSMSASIAPKAAAALHAGDRIERSYAPNASNGSTRHGLGIGLMAGAAAEAGIAAGAGATASAGAGLFYDGARNVRPGAFAGAGAFAGVGAVGAFAGAGVGAFVTNAASATQLAGVAQTYSLNVGVGPLKISLQVGAADGTYMGSVSVGPGIGLDASRYPTHGVASPR